MGRMGRIMRKAPAAAGNFVSKFHDARLEWSSLVQKSDAGLREHSIIFQQLFNLVLEAFLVLLFAFSVYSVS